MNCPSCGAAIPVNATNGATRNAGTAINNIVKKSTGGMSKLKAMGRKRPDLEKGGMTRGGRYARD